MPTYSSDSHRSESSHPQRPGASEQAALLEAGLAALEQKRFDEAIAQLEGVYYTTSRQSIRLKAQMGLVKAYEGEGRFQQALSLCQPLVQNANGSVRQWAEQALHVLEHRLVAQQKHQQKYQENQKTPAASLDEELDVAPETVTVTAVPVGDSPVVAPSSSPPTAAPIAANPTGFMPLEAPDAAEPSGDVTGFQILPSDGTPPPFTDPSAALPPDEPRLESQLEDETLDDDGFMPTSSTAFEVAGLWEDPAAAVRPDAEPDAQQEPDEMLDVSPAGMEGEAIAHDTAFTADENALDAQANPFSFDGMGDVASAEDDTGSEVDGDRTSAPIESPIESDEDLSGSLNIMLPRKKRQKAAPKEAIAPASNPALASDRGVERISERAKTWKPLPASRPLDYWLSLGWAAIALVLLLWLLLRVALGTINPLWQWLSRFMTPPRLYWFESHLMATAIGVVLVFTLVSPWLLRFILGRAYGVTPLPPRELERRSPEANRLLQRACQQQGLPVPSMGLIATQTPQILSYGLIPRTGRMVISQGLLTQLEDDEIAALMAAEIGHIRDWSLIPVTAITCISQIPFLIYWKVAIWGDRRRNPLLWGLAAGLSAAAYGLFWLLRWPGLWVSRTRQRLGDRQAASLTGHPNGLARALCKTTLGMAQDIERQRQTPSLLEGAEMLMPISHRAALPMGTALLRQNPTEVQALNPEELASLLQWDVQNPHRRWLTLNQTHPTLGDRLLALNQVARQWRLRPDLDLTPSSATGVSSKQSSLSIQAAPFFGIPAGLALAMVLWLVGGIAGLANVENLEWMWGDRSLLLGCIAMGYSFGALMRMNAFFPDIKTSETLSEADLPDLLTQPHGLPVDSTSVQLRGKLMGRPGLRNGLYQDLFLRTEAGSLKLHYLSHIGPLGNLILGKIRLPGLVGRQVVVTGWFRRGATPWVDVESLRTDQGRLLRSGHPFWSTLLALAVTLWGAIVIYRGTL